MSPEVEATAREVVEEHEAIGEQQRMVVRQGVDSAAETDVLRPFRSRSDEHFGRRDALVAARVVLADPHLVEAEAIEVLDQVEIALQGERGVLARRMERRHEQSEAHRRIRVHVDCSVKSRQAVAPRWSRRQG